MKDFVQGIERLASRDSEFRKVFCTRHSPPTQRDCSVHPTRVDADADMEHFDDKTSESCIGPFQLAGHPC